MNILLICNNKNLLGNKLVIYTTLYCNSGVNWFICLTEEIGEKEERNIQNLIGYLDPYSIVIFEKIDETKSLEEQFGYLYDFWYIAPDCMVAQTIEGWYEEMQDTGKTLVLPVVDEQPYCTFYINLESNREDDKKTYVKCGNNGIIYLAHQEEKPDQFDTRIGFSGKFSFNFRMPIIFWFNGENKKVYETKLEEWFELYPDFAPSIKQIQLAETIYF